MTRASLREYATVQRERYQHATRAEKHRLLNELVTVTGMHRKAAIRLLRRAPRPPTAPSRAGRPRCYGPDVAAAAEVLWRAGHRSGRWTLVDDLQMRGGRQPDAGARTPPIVQVC